MKVKVFLFNIMVVLYLSMHLTILPTILFGNKPYYVHQTIINLFIIGVTLSVFKNIKTSKRITSYFYLLIPLVLLYVLELLKVFMAHEFIGMDILLVTLNFLTPFVLLIIMSKFFMFIQHRNKNLFYEFIKPYFWFAFMIVIASVSIFILATIGIIDVYSNPIPPGVFERVDGNVNAYSSQYFQKFKSIIILKNQRIPFFNNHGVFCGLSHEPHISTLFVTPSFFLIPYIIKKRRTLIYIIYIVFFLISTSATNLIALLACALVYLFIKLHKTKSTETLILSIFLSIIVSVVGYVYLFPLLNDFIMMKINSGSKDYSTNMLEYLVTPKSFFGYGVWNIPYPFTNYNDIGFSGVILYFIQVLILIYLIVKNLFNKQNLLIGILGIYFFIHSLKIPQHSLIYGFTYYILFLQYLAYKNKIKPRND